MLELRVSSLQARCLTCLDTGQLILRSSKTLLRPRNRHPNSKHRSRQRRARPQTPGAGWRPTAGEQLAEHGEHGRVDCLGAEGSDEGNTSWPRCCIKSCTAVHPRSKGRVSTFVANDGCRSALSTPGRLLATGNDVQRDIEKEPYGSRRFISGINNKPRSWSVIRPVLVPREGGVRSCRPRVGYIPYRGGRPEA